MVDHRADRCEIDAFNRLAGSSAEFLKKVSPRLVQLSLLCE
jgi:hypothetical protein